ncbi:hypothetical protein F4776DRAFT_662279 [Hypoxylon sp. NC0597]|nr:hypothetical protein F4776DRAFT_662279 [Hypoxylon sp. NC0597]
MLAKQQYVYAALVGFGSLAQAAVQFPTCITSCVRQNGCAPTNTDCMCEKASGNFLSEVVVCMNQWCSSDTKFSDLIGPIQSNCKVSQDAIDAAVSKAGFDTSGSGSGSDSDSSSAGSSKASSTEPVISATMGVGAPNKVDGSTSAPEATGTATKGGNAGSQSSALITDSTAIITATPTASGSLLVATTLSSVPSATGTSSSSASSESSTSDESSGSTDGSPAGSSTGGENAATTSQASLLAAVMAVAAAMAFGW